MKAWAVFRAAAMSLLAVCALGCSRKAPEKEGPVTVVFKSFKFPSSGPIEALLGEFEKRNPGIRVRHETLPNSSDQQHQFYVTNLEAKSADFDVFALDVIWGPEFTRTGWLLELTPYLPAGGLKGFFSGPVEAVTTGGKVYGVPLFIDAGLLYYRKDLLEKYGLKPPVTFGELKKCAEAVLKGENNPGLKGYIWQGKQYEGLVCTALEFIWGAGGDVIGPDGRCVIDGPEAVSGVSFMRELLESGVSPGLVTTADEEICRNIFGNGDAVFMRNWPYCWNIYQSPDSAVRGKVGITVIPHFEGHPSASTLGGWQLGINRFSVHRKEAWKLLEFLTGTEGQKAIALGYGFKPTRRSLYKDPEIVEQQPFITGLAEVMESAKPRPVHAFYPMISQALQSELSAAMVGAKEPARALRDAKAKIDKVLAL